MLTAGPIFGKSGFAGARLDDIAAAAGVTKPILYRHFDSKKHLYIALLEKHESDLPSFLVHADELAPSAEIETVLRAVLEHWFDYVRANQHSWLMLFRDSSGDSEIRQLRVRVSARAREVLGGFIATRRRSRLAAGEVVPTAELLVSGLAGLALWWIDHPEVAKDVVIDIAARVAAPAFAEPG